TDDENRAATKAREIYQTVAARGWDAAFRRFCREITVAIFWAASPAACTYTTLFTFVGDPTEAATPAREPVRPPRKIALIEFDPAVRSTLAFWLNRQLDRKSTRLNSSHVAISYAVFCLKKNKLHCRSTGS